MHEGSHTQDHRPQEGDKTSYAGLSRCGKGPAKQHMQMMRMTRKHPLKPNALEHSQQSFGQSRVRSTRHWMPIKSHVRSPSTPHLRAAQATKGINHSMHANGAHASSQEATAVPCKTLWQRRDLYAQAIIT